MSDFLKRTEPQILHDYYDDAIDVVNPTIGGNILYGGIADRDQLKRGETLPDCFKYVSSDYECLYPKESNTTNIHTFIIKNTESGKTYKVIISRQRCHKCVVKSVEEITED